MDVIVPDFQEAKKEFYHQLAGWTIAMCIMANER